MKLIIAVIAFMFGSVFGIFVEALMMAAHDEDEIMQQWGRRDEKK